MIARYKQLLYMLEFFVIAYGNVIVDRIDSQVVSLSLDYEITPRFVPRFKDSRTFGPSD